MAKSSRRKVHKMADIAELPNLVSDAFQLPDLARLKPVKLDHKPRILLLYGSLRERSYSRFLTLEAERLLNALGADTRVFHANGLPLPDAAADTHPKVQELREAMLWSEGQVWTSPERHGAMSGVMKAQIDWIPLPGGAVRPTQGRTLAVMQVSGGSQSFNAVNQMRVLGRWMRMITIPNQSSRRKGMAGVHARGSNEALILLRPGRRRNGGACEVHVANARDRRPTYRPLQ